MQFMIILFWGWCQSKDFFLQQKTEMCPTWFDCVKKGTELVAADETARDQRSFRLVMKYASDLPTDNFTYW